jgi:hypothetical protein
LINAQVIQKATKNNSNNWLSVGTSCQPPLVHSKQSRSPLIFWLASAAAESSVALLGHVCTRKRLRYQPQI